MGFLKPAAPSGPAHSPRPVVISCSSIGCGHNIADSRESQGSLGLSPTRVVARVAVDRLVLAEFSPVEIRWKIGTAFYSTRRINVNRPHARSAWLRDFTANVAGDLL